MSDLDKNEANNAGVELASQPKQPSTARRIAVLALLLSMLNITAIFGLSYYLQNKWVLGGAQTMNKEPPLDKQAIVAHDDDKFRQQLQQLQSDHVDLVEKVKQQQQEVTSLHYSFGELFKNRYQWLLNETEYGLGVVILQLVNTGNVENAIYSLKYMQERLSSFEYPELLPLKKSIAQDIENLAAAQVIGISDTLVKLDVLSSKVDGLSLVVDSVLKNREVNTEKIKRSLNQPYYMALWHDFIATIKSGIQVRRLERPDPMLISPDQAFFIKENIKLGLLNVRLALLQRQQDLYVQYLHEIKSTIKEYFDVESYGVKEFLDSMEELAALNIMTPSVELMKNSIAIVKSLQSNQVLVPINSKSVGSSVPSENKRLGESQAQAVDTQQGKSIADEKDKDKDKDKEKEKEQVSNSVDNSDNKPLTKPENSEDLVKVTE